MLSDARLTVLSRGLAACVATLGVSVSPGIMAQSGLFVVPSLSVEEVYDDNIFFQLEDETSDFFTRVSPQLDLGYESETLSWLLSYRNDAEWYRDLSDLDSTTARRFGIGSLEYQLNRRLTITSNAEYTRTNTAEDLSLTPGGVIPGLVGRAEAERRLFGAGAEYQFSPRVTGDLTVTWTEDELIDLGENERLSATSEFEHVLAPNRSMVYGYQYRRYDLEIEPEDEGGTVSGETEDTNTAWIGMTQELNATNSLELRAGPRFSDGDLEPYALVAWTREYARGSTVVDALLDETVVLGDEGRLESRSVSATWTHNFSPELSMSSRAGYAYLSNTGYSLDITTFQLSGAYQFNPYLALTARYSFNNQVQERNGFPRERVTQNIVTLGLTITRPRPGQERS